MKKIFLHILYIIPWYIFIYIIFIHNKLTSYNSIILSTYIILNFLISYSIFNTITKSNLYYKLVVLANYILNQTLLLNIFYIKDFMLTFINTTSIFISSLYLYEATYNINKHYATYLLPFIIISLISLFISLILVFIHI